MAVAIAMAGLLSTFFTGTLKQQTSEAGSNGKQITQCSSLMSKINIRSEGVVVADDKSSMRFMVENNADRTLESPEARVFNTRDGEIQTLRGDNVTPRTIPPRGLKYVKLSNISVGGCIDKVELLSAKCPGYKTVLERPTCIASWS